MTAYIDAATLKAWLADKSEIALIDAREMGEFANGHLLFAVPIPYSVFEIELPRLVPNRATRLVICDGGHGVAERAACRAIEQGYRSVHVLRGGVPAWRAAGFNVFSGVNVPSKVLGEIVEHERHTPQMSARELVECHANGEDLVIVDGRPFSEFAKMSIPGAICCPNGELALRIHEIAPSPRTRIIVNCAGRTRSIIGAQTLIDLGLPNPVHALENGTQGWFLAGLELEHGASGLYRGKIDNFNVEQLKRRADELARRDGVAFVSFVDVERWMAEPDRTTYLLDVRTAEENARKSVPAFAHAPGGQLIQATDQWVGVRGARIVVLGGDDGRAPVVARWLLRLGYQTAVFEGGIDAAECDKWPSPKGLKVRDRLPLVSAPELASAIAEKAVQVIDVRQSMSYRKAHIPQSAWSIRPRIVEPVLRTKKPVVLIADNSEIAALAAHDLIEAGSLGVRALDGGIEAWHSLGLPLAADTLEPRDSDCIDFVFFAHGRHDGNADAARLYLDWECGLLNQLDADE